MRAQEVDLFGAFEAPEAIEHGTLAWRKKDDGAYQVTYPGSTTTESVTITPAARGYEITRTEFGEKTYIAPIVTDVHEAFRSAEHWLKINFGGQAEFLRRESPKRAVPASGPQISRLKRLGAKNLNFDKLTSGQASDLITYHSNPAA